jgi:hypothetical protein
VHTIGIALAILLTGCGVNGFSAEELSPPFPGAVIAANARHADCTQAERPIDYRVQITNTSDRDAFVQSCSAAELNPPFLLADCVGGPWVLHPRRCDEVYPRPVLFEAGETFGRLVGGSATERTGLDWHGRPPL